MAKKTVSVFELVEKYLTHIGVPKTVLNTALLPSKYDSVIYCRQQKKSNIVSANKQKLSGNETHIDVAKSVWHMFFTPTQTTTYLTTYNHCESNQNFLFFEANLEAMLARRTRKASTLIKLTISPKKTYTSSSSNILNDTGRKWIDDQNGITHVHLSKTAFDGDVFYDFRLGLLIDDYLIFLKEKYTDKVLAISIPCEFANRYVITKAKQNMSSLSKLAKDAEQAADAVYVAAMTKTSITPSYSPAAPQPAPAPKRTSKGKPRYIANPSIGKGALARAGYICENCGQGTFTARSTGQNFMEPHHLIPLSRQGYYGSKIDITANLICLCPNCHSKIHYGLKPDIQVMLRTFLAARDADLKIGGIDIDENTLFAYYNI